MSKATCYYPGGGKADGFLPCDTTSGQSACCAPGHYCFTNGLCLDTVQMTTYRGGCTDKSYNAAACPRYCTDFIGVCGVWACNNNNKFACNFQDCGNSSQMFTVNGGSIQQNAALNDALATTSTAASATTTTPSENQQPSSAISSYAAAESCPSQVGAYAGIGAGLGISLLLALIALLLLFLQLRKQKKQNQAADTVSSHSENKQYMQPPSSVANNSYGSGYYSPTPSYNPSTRLEAELPSGVNNQRTELPANLDQRRS